MHGEYEVVIIYRRGPRWAAATLTHHYLMQRGRKAYIDHANGQSLSQIESAIHGCRVAVIMVGPGDFDPVAFPDNDYLIQIVRAFAANCIVVPVLTDNFTYERYKTQLVSILTELPKLQVIRVDPNQPYFGLERVVTEVEKHIPMLPQTDDLWLPPELEDTTSGERIQISGDMRAASDSFCQNAEESIRVQDWMHAGAMIRRAFDISTELPRPHRVLGDLYAARGQFDQAANEYSTALEHDPNDIRALDGRMEMNLRRGRPQLAFDDAAHAVLLTRPAKTEHLAREYAMRFGTQTEHAFKRILAAIARRRGETAEAEQD